jgi:hypothetical protein
MPSVVQWIVLSIGALLALDCIALLFRIRAQRTSTKSVSHEVITPLERAEEAFRKVRTAALAGNGLAAAIMPLLFLMSHIGIETLGLIVGLLFVETVWLWLYHWLLQTRLSAAHRNSTPAMSPIQE